MPWPSLQSHWLTSLLWLQYNLILKAKHISFHLLFILENADISTRAVSKTEQLTRKQCDKTNNKTMIDK